VAPSFLEYLIKKAKPINIGQRLMTGAVRLLTGRRQLFDQEYVL